MAGEDADLESGDEHDDPFTPVLATDSDVVETSGMAEGELAVVVDPVLTDPYSFASV